jgi:hypothetical protein
MIFTENPFVSSTEGDRLSETKISVRRLRDFATQLPIDLPLRDILLAEEDEIPVSTFLARLPVWLQLSKFKRSRN